MSGWSRRGTLPSSSALSAPPSGSATTFKPVARTYPQTRRLRAFYSSRRILISNDGATFLGLLYGLGLSVRKCIKGGVNLYLGSEDYWDRVCWNWVAVPINNSVLVRRQGLARFDVQPARENRRAPTTLGDLPVGSIESDLLSDPSVPGTPTQPSRREPCPATAGCRLQAVRETSEAVGCAIDSSRSSFSRSGLTDEPRYVPHRPSTAIDASQPARILPAVFPFGRDSSGVTFSIQCRPPFVPLAISTAYTWGEPNIFELNTTHCPSGVMLTLGSRA